MTSVAEASQAKHQLASVLADGVNAISESQSISFRRYARVVLPVDGSVFWVLSGPPQQFQGSFHYSTDQGQREDESETRNHVIFTSLKEVNPLNETSPDVLWIGEFEGVRFAFNQRRPYYRQSGLFHYTGTAVLATMASQVVDSLGDIFEQAQVVSNSLPIWLTLSDYAPMFPSFLVPPNQSPPYVAVHVSRTDALQAVPADIPEYATTNGVIIKPLQVRGVFRSQLTKDTVRLTLWGMRNDQAQRFMDYLLCYMMSHDTLGLMNMPVLRDEKKGQSELNILGQKKVLEFEVSYYQDHADACSRKLIQSVVPHYILEA